MKRAARLQFARHWLPTYGGKNIVRGYAKWFGVDLECAIKGLQSLGVGLDPDYVLQLRMALGAVAGAVLVHYQHAHSSASLEVGPASAFVTGRF